MNLQHYTLIESVRNRASIGCKEDGKPRPPRRSSLWFTLSALLLLTLLILSSCNIGGQSEPTPVPFEVTPYSPDVPLTTDETAGSDTASDVTNGATVATNSQQGAVVENDSQSATAAESANTGTTQPSAALPAATGTTLRYNGEIAAEQQVVVVAETAGMVLSLPLDIGDVIREGQLIAQLDTMLLDAQRAQTLAGLEAAQAQLDLLQADADEDDLAAARAGVAAASAAYRRALEGPTAEDRRLALAQLKQAEAAVTVAQAAYNRVKGNPAIAALPESLQLQQATIAIEAAQAQYDKVLIGSTEDVIAGAFSQLAQARASLRRLEEGAQDEQIRATEAQVRQAEMALYLAQLQVSKATVKAPVAGVVSRVNSAEGAMASPGTPLVTLLSNEVKITIAVEETRIAQLELGQPAFIRVNAYPDQVFAGTVTIVAPELDAATRTVEVTIRPDEGTDLLAPGMFATVELVIGE